MSDYDNKWISVHEPSGKFVSKFGGNRLLGPKGLTVAQTGELVVVDNKVRIYCVTIKCRKPTLRHPVFTFSSPLAKCWQNLARETLKLLSWLVHTTQQSTLMLTLLFQIFTTII